MSSQQNKIIPKLKKKLQGFLTDESGKIAKEDVLKMSMLAMGVAGMMGGAQDVSAGHANVHGNAGSHCSSNPPSIGGHASWTPHANSAYNAHANANNHANNDPGHANRACIWDAGAAYQGTTNFVVNGHVNLVNNVRRLNGWHASADAPHGNSSHGAHGSCGGGHW